MSHEYREHLSALMDGELQRDESRFLLKRLERDGELGATWSRFHIARQALRRQDIHMLRPDFAAGVLSRIDAEAVPVRRTGAWLRWASGGAVAASVAVAALVLTQPAVETADTGVAASPRTPSRPGTPVAAAPASVSTLPQELRAPMSNSVVLPVQPASVTIGDADWAQPAAVLDPRLQSYLIRHYQAVGAAGQSGVVPYVLLATPTPQQAAPANDQNR